MVSSAVIFALALVATVNADVSHLSLPTSNLLAPASSALPLKPIVITDAQASSDVPYGVNPFGRNANQRPLPKPAAAAVAPTATPVVAAAPRLVAQPRALVPQLPQLAAPRPFQLAQQRVVQAPAPAPQFRPQPILAPQPKAQQQRRALPVVDRSLINEINAQILRQDQEINRDGSYQFSFETDNGIVRQESGTPKVVGNEVAEQVTGSFSYVENGVPYQVTYVADENGFRAFGDHLPTPPPTPPHVLRTLEILAKLPKNQL